MRVLGLLRCIGKAAFKHVGNLAGFGLGDLAVSLAEAVWKEWNKEQDVAQRQAEMQALVQMAGEEFREQVAAVVSEVAANQAGQVQQQLAALLSQVLELARSRFRRPEDREGRSLPPGFQLRQASDLIPLVSFRPLASAPPPRPAPLSQSNADQSRASVRPEITLEYTHGPHAGQSVTFNGLTVLIFGRDKECDPRVPQEQSYKRISRNHALLEINPPDIRVRDLGSMNGTYVNETLLGKRPKGSDPDAKHASLEYNLSDGDEVRLTDSGVVAFRVHVRTHPQCSGCGAWLVEQLSAGQHLCAACHQRVQGEKVKRTCGWCHRDVAGHVGVNRPGLLICSDCRNNMQAIIQEMLGQANAGNSDLRAIKDYSFIEELGHGGMGAVYLARHNRTTEPAAIKLMLPEVAADDLAVELFQREIRNTMSLRHQHVVRLLDHGFAQGAFFMVLEYCNGGSAQDLVDHRGAPLPIDEAGEIILQALEGLTYTHHVDIPFVKQKGGGFAPGRGIVHRDLKPANLFLTGWGSSRTVKIGDYGLAKALEESGLTGGTRTGACAGTWHFMCRQQFRTYSRVGPEVDVWSLAASLYYLLTAQFPRNFPRGREPSLVVLEDPAVPIRKRNAAIPARLAEVVDEALKEPEMPFKTATVFKDALEAAL